MDALHGELETLVLDERLHDILALLKGFRNGIVYGAKVRLPHALVEQGGRDDNSFTFLFRNGTTGEKLRTVLNTTRQHAVFLGLFSFTYKSIMILLKRLQSREERMHSLLAGALAGSLVFGRSRGPVNRQLVLYVLGQAVWSLGNALSVERPAKGRGGSTRGPKGVLGDGGPLARGSGARMYAEKHAWTVFAGVCWAVMMYLFRWHPECLNGTAWSSMDYIYAASDHWNSWWTLLVHNE